MLLFFLQTFALMENTINKLKLLNGCQDSEISMTVTSGDANEHTIENVQCQGFHESGGRLTVPSANDFGGTDIDYAANASFEGQGTSCSSASCKDIFVLVATDAKTCSAMNSLVGITGDVTGGYDNIRPWQGDFDGVNNPANWRLGSLHSVGIDGFNAGCFQGDPGLDYNLYYVLVAR